MVVMAHGGGVLWGGGDRWGEGYFIIPNMKLLSREKQAYAAQR